MVLLRFQPLPLLFVLFGPQVYLLLRLLLVLLLLKMKLRVRLFLLLVQLLVCQLLRLLLLSLILHGKKSLSKRIIMALKYAIVRTNDITGEIQDVLYTAHMINLVAEEFVGKRKFLRRHAKLRIMRAFDAVEVQAQNFTSQL